MFFSDVFKQAEKLKSREIKRRGAVDCSIDAGHMNGVLMLCVMVHVLVWVMVC